MGSLLKAALEGQNWEVAALCLVYGYVQALDKDQELQVTLKKLRLLQAQNPGAEVPPEVTATLLRTASMRAP